MINVAYGVLTNGTVSEGSIGYRYSDVKTPISARASVSALLSLVSENARGAFVNLLLELMRSSCMWPDFVRQYDKNNTYQTEVLADCFVPELSEFQFSDLVAWADSCPLNSKEFSRTVNDTAIDRVCSALFSVASVVE